MSGFHRGEKYRVGPDPRYCFGPNEVFTEGDIVTVSEDGVDNAGDVRLVMENGTPEWLQPSCLIERIPDVPPIADNPPTLTGRPLARAVALGVARETYGPDLPASFYAEIADFILEGKTK